MSVSIFSLHFFRASPKGLQRGKLNTDWLTNFLAQQVPEIGIQVYSLDSTAWVRPRAETMDERSIVRVPVAGTAKGHMYNVGYEYSLLDWVPEANNSWSLSVAVNRVPFEESVLAVGVEQVRQLNEARKGKKDAVDIVAGDAR